MPTARSSSSSRSALTNWAVGLLCGLGAASMVAVLPGPSGLVLAASAVLAGGLLVQRHRLRRRRAVVWQEPAW